MSISYEGYVVWGFEIEPRDVIETVIRYDTKTGEPYELEQVTGECGMFQEKRVLNDLHTPPEGLEILQSGYESGRYILGDVIGRVTDYQNVVCIEEEPSEQLQAFADKFALVPVRYLILSCG